VDWIFIADIRILFLALLFMKALKRSWISLAELLRLFSCCESYFLRCSYILKVD